MGGNHEYGSGDAPRDDSRGYGGGQRGYGGRGDDRGYGGQAPPPGQGDPGGSGPTRSYGEPPGGGGGRRGYGQGSDSGQNAGSGQSAGGGQRGYGSPPAGGAGRPGGYGERPRGYERPVDSYGESSRRRPRGPVPGEVVPPDPDPAARRAGALPGQSTRGYDDPVTDPDSPPDGPPRRSRVEERRAARNGGDGSTEPEEREYAPGQERSSRYGRSALDGRRTRNGAARNAGNRSGRPVKKTGYHRYFDYPRTGKLGWRRWMPSIKQVCSAGLACIFLMIGLFVYEYATVQIPSESSIELAQSTNYTYDDGSTVFATTGSVNRENVNISEIPKTMQNAIVAAEDKTFWSNPGISVTGIARAFLNDAEGKDQLQGGSTLTQQFVKNAYLTDNQTFSRKFKEIFIALKIGQTKSKDWVLENYLNTVFFGRNADGIQEGSQAWFGESASQLTDPSHAAFMAALVNQPTNFSLGFSSDSNQAEQTYWQGQLKERWKAILDNMLSYGMITKAQWTTATANFPTPVNPSQSTAGSPLDQQMQNAVDSWISTYASANPNSGIPTPDQIASGGYTVETTFNKQYMADAQQAVQDQFLSQIEENSSSWYNQNLYPSLAAVDPSTGDLIAFYGGTTSFNYATQGQSPPGSSFKAFTLATAYKNNYSPNSYLNGNSPWPDQSNPQEVAAAQGDPPVYNESTNDQYGQITINTATADSVNTAFVRLSDQLGYNNVLSTVNSFGINSGNANGLAANARLTLGIADVSTARMASAYSGFADNGELYPLIMVKQIVSQGGVVWKPNDTPTQVLQPNVAETVTSSLFHVTHDAGATAAGVVGLTGGLNNIAGKTGTSTMDLTNIEENYPSLYHYTENGYFSTAAAWFNGYTTKLESAVAVARYVPNPDAGQPGQPPVLDMPVDNINGSGPAYGDSLAVPVWAEFMKLMQNTPFGGDAAFPTPNISQMQIMNSPSASASPSSSPSQQPSDMPTTGGPGQPTPSDSSTCTSGFFGLGNNCTSRSSSPSASATPSASSSSKFGGGNGGIGGQAATESSKEDE
jgi:membrane peptidoglycan carboxypeptidase